MTKVPAYDAGDDRRLDLCELLERLKVITPSKHLPYRTNLLHVQTLPRASSDRFIEAPAEWLIERVFDRKRYCYPIEFNKPYAD